jgi:hypothetical protein
MRRTVISIPRSGGVEQQVTDGGGLPTGNDQPVYRAELLAAPDGHCVGSGFGQRGSQTPAKRDPGAQLPTSTR